MSSADPVTSPTVPAPSVAAGAGAGAGAGAAAAPDAAVPAVVAAEAPTAPADAPPTQPAAPTFVSEFEELSEEQKVATTFSRVRFAAPEGATSVKVEMAQPTYFYDEEWQSETLPATATEVTFNNLVPYTKYHARVSAINDAGVTVSEKSAVTLTMTVEQTVSVLLAQEAQLKRRIVELEEQTEASHTELTRRRAAELDEIRKEVLSLNDYITKVTHVKAELERDNEKLEREKAGLKATVEELQADVAAHTQSIAAASTQTEELQEKLEKVRLELCASKLMEAATDKKKEDAVHARLAAEQKLTQVTAEVEVLRPLDQRLKEATAANERLEAKVADLMSSTDSVTSRFADANSELAKVQAELDAVTASRDSTSAKLAKMSDSERTLKQKLDEVNDEVAAMRAQVVLSAELHPKLEAEQKSHAAAKAKVEALEQTLADLREKEARDADIAAAAAAAAAQQADADKLRIRQLEADVERMRAALDTAERSEAGHLDRIRELTRQRADASTSSTESVSEITALRLSLEDTKQALAAEERETARLKRELSGTTGRDADAGARIASLNQTVSELQSTIGTMRAELASKTSMVTSLEQQVADLNRDAREHSLATARQLQLQDDNARLEERVHMLQMQMTTRDEKDARDTFRARLPPARVEEFMGHFRYLKGMEFETAKAIEAVVRHPESRQLQTNHCLP